MTSSTHLRPVYAEAYERGQSETKRFEEWCRTAWREDPKPFDDPSLPSFPIEVLPPWGGNFVRAIAQATATPVDLAAIVYLGLLSTALAKKVRIRVRPDWIEQVNLYLVVALESAAGKSTVFKHIMEPVYGWQSAQREACRAELAQLVARRQTLEESIREAQRRAARAIDDPALRARMQEESDRLSVDLEALPLPTKPLYVVEDTTPEALASLLFEHGERMAALSPEGGELFQIMAGRYSKDSNIGIYLKAYGGDTTIIHRRGREEILEEPILTLVLTVQPSVIHDLIGNEHFRNRGLVGRFIYALPESTLGSRDFDRPPIDPGVKARYATAVLQLLNIPSEVRLTVTLDALAELEALFDRIECSLDPVMGSLAYMQAWAGRISGTTARIAGLLHMAGKGGEQISAETMRRAVTLARDYLLPHAKRAHAVMEIDEATTAAKKLLRVIARKRWSRFPVRELHQAAKGQQRFKRREGVDAALETLKKLEYVKPLPHEKDVWAVHPRWDPDEWLRMPEDA